MHILGISKLNGETKVITKIKKKSAKTKQSKIALQSSEPQTKINILQEIFLMAVQVEQYLNEMNSGSLLPCIPAIKLITITYVHICFLNLVVYHFLVSNPT